MFNLIKNLWFSDIPYGKESKKFKRELRFVKEHGPIFLMGIGAILAHNVKWTRKLVKAGIFIASSSPSREEPKQLPPPKTTPKSPI